MRQTAFILFSFIMQRLIPTLLIMILAFPAMSQELNGIWKGTLTISPGGCFQVYNIELQITIDDQQNINGISYHYSDLQNYVKEEFDGNYDAKGMVLSINENKIITYHVPPDCIPCIKKYALVYKNENKIETLSGSMGGKMINNAGICPPGTIVLTRIKESAFKEIDQKQELPATLSNRTNELVREIKVDTGDIRLDFYDNGIIDGDTISVYANNQAIVSNKGLTTVPITVYVRIDAMREKQEIVMAGQNLGTIPPNTALMIVTAGTKRYQLYLTSDEQKNAMVRYVYEKPD